MSAGFILLSVRSLCRRQRRMGRRRTKAGRGKQLTIRLQGHGGARAGAGRPRSPKSGMPHGRRPSLCGREPLLVTLKLVQGLASLRTNRLFRRVLAGLVKAKERFDTRIVHFSVQSDHVHLLAETASKGALSRAMKGLAVRLARAVNRELGRRGAVLRDRCHARLLATPRQTRNANSRRDPEPRIREEVDARRNEESPRRSPGRALRGDQTPLIRPRAPRPAR